MNDDDEGVVYAVDGVDVTSLTVEQLKQELMKRQLPTTGRKQALVDRLVDVLNATTNEEEMPLHAVVPANDSGTDSVVSEQSMMIKLMETMMQVLTNEMPSRQANPTIEVQTVPDLTGSLPEFSGVTTESVEEWLDAINLVKEQQKLAPEQLLPVAVSRLRGPAKDWHRAVGRNLHDWSPWKDGIRKEFGHKLTLRLWTRRVEARTQNAAESLTEYVYAKLRLLKTNCPVCITEKDEIDYLVDGIRNKHHAVNIAMHEISSVSQLLQIARRIDKTESDTSKQVCERKDSDFMYSIQKNGINERKPVIKMDQKPQQDVSKIRKDPRWNKQMPLGETRCFRCQQFGHLARNCQNAVDAAIALNKSKTLEPSKQSKPKETKDSYVHLVHQTRPKAPMINVYVPMIGNIPALIDTGSCITLIRKDVLPDNIVIEDQDMKEYIGVGNMSVKTLGCIKLCIGLNNEISLHNVGIIEQSPIQFILGNDWIDDAGIQVTFKNKNYEIRNKKGEIIPLIEGSVPAGSYFLFPVEPMQKTAEQKEVTTTKEITKSQEIDNAVADQQHMKPLISDIVRNGESDDKTEHRVSNKLMCMLQNKPPLEDDVNHNECSEDFVHLRKINDQLKMVKEVKSLFDGNWKKVKFKNLTMIKRRLQAHTTKSLKNKKWIKETKKMRNWPKEEEPPSVCVPKPWNS